MQQVPSFFLTLASCLIFISCSEVDEDLATNPIPTTTHPYDNNQDGQLSSEEEKTMNEKFVARFDTNRDNQLDARERAEVRKNSTVIVNPKSTPITKEDAMFFLGRYDSDQNGVVSKQEVEPRVWRVMQQADKDKDESVSVDEWVNRMK